MKEVQAINVFVSCPGDVKEELDSIKLIFTEVNKTSGKDHNYRLEFINWDLDTYTGIGEDAQAVINTQIEAKYDILLAIVWMRLGTETKRDVSGTAEEINRAIERKKAGEKIELMIYFNTGVPESLSDIDPVQLGKVESFKNDLEQKGVLYKKYDSIQKFDSLLRVNISQLIKDKLIDPIDESSIGASSEPNKPNKYSDITEIIKQVDSTESESTYDDIFEEVIQIEESFKLMNDSLTRMTTIIESLGSVMQSKTEEINRITAIKDTRLKQKKGSLVINSLANDLSDFNSRLSTELPIFTEHLNTGLETYSKILISFKDFQDDESKEMVLEFRNSMEFATRGCADMLKIVMALPPLNTKFNNSKRETSQLLKELTKELLNSLTLMDEISGIN